MEIKPLIAKTSLTLAQEGALMAVGVGTAAATAAIVGAPILAAVAVTATYMAVADTVTLVADQIINRTISEDKPVKRLVANLAAIGGAFGAGIGAAVAVVALTPLSISLLAGVGITLTATVVSLVIAAIFTLCMTAMLRAYANHSDANAQKLWRFYTVLGLHTDDNTAAAQGT